MSYEPPASQYEKLTDTTWCFGMKEPTHRMTGTGWSWLMTRIWQCTEGNIGVQREDRWWREGWLLTKGRMTLPQSNSVLIRLTWPAFVRNLPARRKLVARRGYVFFVRLHWQLLGFPETKVLSRCCQTCLCVHHPQQLPSWSYIYIIV